MMVQYEKAYRQGDGTLSLCLYACSSVLTFYHCISLRRRCIVVLAAGTIVGGEDVNLAIHNMMP